MHRVLRAALVGVLVLGMLVACSPAVRGVGGVRRDASGALEAVLAWCSDFGELTTVSLYTVSADGAVHGPLVTLERSGEAPAERYVEIGLAHPPTGWRSTSNLPELDPTGTYEVRAWGGGGRNRVNSFPFQLSELRSATAMDGSILTKTYAGDGRYEAAYVTPEGLRDAAERTCRG